jgi:TonB family protein
MLLWAAGTLAAFAQMLVACAGMWRVRRSARPSPDRLLSRELAQGLGIPHAVEVLETSAGTMPMTFGILRPAVFMPLGAAAWSEDRRRIVLLHELAHVRRGDAATQLLARLALVVNWWNPLAWTAWREFLKERERATDDMVLDAGARASDYAGHLLEVARAMQATPALGWAAVAMARPSQLEGRLLAILDSRLNRKTAGRASALASALLAVAVVAPFAAVRAQNTAAIPPDVDALIRAGVAQKNHEMLDKAAVAFEALRQYENAQNLLESSAAIREEVSGKQSFDYGIGLLKIAGLAQTRRRNTEAESAYTQAVQVLGDRPEAAAALIYLGLRKTNLSESIDYFERAQRLDPSLAGPAMTWSAVAQQRSQNPAEAEALFNSALAAENPNSSDAVNTLQLYARLLKEQGREEEEKAMLERATIAQKELYRQTAQTPAGSDVLRVGGGVLPPSVLSKSEPEYSQEARFAKYAGTVLVYLEIRPDGIPQNIRIVKGLGLGLDESAIASIEKWRFRPGTKDGVPVTVAAHVEVNFRLM